MKQREIETAALADLATRFGTPTYAYFEHVARARIGALREIAPAPRPFRLLYAVKANDSPALLSIMRDEGLGVDVVSAGELELALALGWSPKHIFFSANNPSDDELARARETGVVVNIGEPDRLAWFAEQFPGAEVCLRLNLTHGAGHHEHVVTGGRTVKFGISPHDLPVIRRLEATGRIRIVGLHQHIGSGNLDPGIIGAAMAELAHSAGGFPALRFVNFGGGIGVPYRSEDPPLDLTAFSRYLAAAADVLPPRAEVWLEPGRFLVAESGVLLVRTISVKSTSERTFAGTDSGMNHLIRPALYGAFHEVSNVSRPDGTPTPYDVVGNICESSDFFARQQLVAEIRVGDILAIWDAGAYGMSMSSEYNMRPKPAEVVVDREGNARLVRRRMTAADMCARALLDYRSAEEPIKGQ